MAADEWQPPCAPSRADATADEALMKLVCQDDAMALHQLMVRYWQPVVAYTRRILGDPDAAADIAQQTFIRLWQARGRWTPSGSVSAFIFRIARNAASNELRARRSRSQVCESSSHDPVSTPWTPLELLEEKELRAAFQAALGRLPPRRKEVYLLARDRGLSYHEISAIMGISPQTVANQMTSAVADLRRHLSDLVEKQ